MPNAFVDEYAHVLTSDEFKVLTFITRRILGFHNSREIRRNKISLSQIHGTIKAKNKKGEFGIVSFGVGLSRPTVIKCLESLEKFKFIFKIGEATNNGQEFELNIGNIEPIAADELQKRKNKKNKAEKTKSKKRENTKRSRLMTFTTGESMSLTTTQQNQVVNDINQVVNDINHHNFEDNLSNNNDKDHKNVHIEVVNGINPLKQTVETHNIETNSFAPFGASAANAADRNDCLDDVDSQKDKSAAKIKKSSADERRKLLEWWNGLGIVKHNGEPKSGKTTLQSALDGILRTGETMHDVCLTIENYRDILNDPKSRFTYKWGLTDFLVRGYSKFTDRDVAFHNYVKSGLNGNGRDGTANQNVVVEDLGELTLRRFGLA